MTVSSWNYPERTKTKKHKFYREYSNFPIIRKESMVVNNKVSFKKTSELEHHKSYYCTFNHLSYRKLFQLIQSSLNASHPIFPIPFAISIGPQRAGTSWLYRYLRSRGDICLPNEVKEVFFFDYNYERGEEYYTSHFEIEDVHKYVMEITTTSFHHPEAPKRIYECFGKDVKLICPLRHPVARSYSLYKHYLRYGLVEGTLEEALQKKPEIYISSFYTKQLENWIKVFGKDNIFFCFQENLKTDQEEYVENICDYLNIPFIPVEKDLQGHYNAATHAPIKLIAKWAQKCATLLRYYKLYWIINLAKKIGLKKIIFGRENPNPDDSFIPYKERELLEKYLGKEVKKLEDFLGYKIECWKEKY